MPPQRLLNHSQEHQGSQNASKYSGVHFRLAISMAMRAAGGCSVSVVAKTSINNPTAKAIIRAWN